MKEYERTLVDILVGRFREVPRTIIAVQGPRQSGKTTAVRQALEKSGLPCLYCSSDLPEHLPATSTSELMPVPASSLGASELRQRWEYARRDAERRGENFVLVLDEIQKIPQWSNTVKGLWDQDRAQETPLHVVILGSSPWAMQSGLKESLMGRFEEVISPHWSYAEMRDAFGYDLNQYIYYGGYPGAVNYLSDPARWRKYILRSIISPGIENDILSMVRIEKPALMKNLFEMGVHYSGQLLEYKKILADLGEPHDAKNVAALSDYRHLLSETGFLSGLEQCSRKLVAQKKSHPKWLALNTALMSANSPHGLGDLEQKPEFKGRLVESAVGAHLYNTAIFPVRLCYWRDDPHEVDFVLQKGDRLVAIEVKTGTCPSHTSGLREFARRFKPERQIIVSDIDNSLKEILLRPAGYWFE